MSQRPPGHVLRDARLASGTSQAELARALGCEQSSVARWERGEMAPDPEVRTVLWAVLGIPVHAWSPGAMKRVEKAIARARALLRPAGDASAP